MDKERLRIPSDSSSGSSSRGGASPNLSSYRSNSAAYLLTNNNIGPPPNSPASYSPLLPPTASHSLHPPPGLPHPSLRTMYPFPPCPSPGYQAMNFQLGMSGNQSHITPQHYPSATGTSGQFEMNGYHAQNMGPGTPPPPGYNFYGSRHPPHTTSQACAIHPNQQQNCGPLNASQHGIYNQSGDSNDLEKRLNLLLNSNSNYSQERYDAGVGFGGNDFMTSHTLTSFPKEMLNTNAMLLSHFNEEKQPITNTISGVKNPIIENFVGAMSMCNGTYTHFGPSNTQTSKAVPENDVFGELNLIGMQNGNGESDSRAVYPKNSITAIKQEPNDPLKEKVIGILSNPIRKQNVQVADPIIEIGTEKVMKNMSMTSAEEQFSLEPRASSPGESAETSSRPQTPGKPSYLEVLTKTGGVKSQSNVSSNRKASSTSSSPVQSAFSTSSDSVPNLSHRKSVDYFVGATASSPASSCPSASSSPATKPRTLVSGLFLKGKENVSSSVSNIHSKQSTVSKNSPSNSPTHCTQNHLPKAKLQSSIGERKVLSSQNSTSGSAKSGKSIRNGKVPTEKTVELEESNVHDESEWGWRTYTSRGRNNNLSSVGNKNSQRRTVSGSCESDTTASNIATLENEEEDETVVKKNNGDDVAAAERKSNSLGFGTSSNVSSLSHSRKPKDKDKPRNKKEDRNWRNCISRRLETLVYIWLTHMISALSWLWSLVTDVASLSASLGVSLLYDFYMWTKIKAVPNFTEKVVRWRKEVRQRLLNWWSKLTCKISSMFSRSGQSSKKHEDTSAKGSPRGDENILSLLGPERNIILPSSGDEALKRLLSVKGQDPYSILGVRSDSSDETIRRYYKRQAVLVHPDKNLIVGAEEAFKILARAFEMVGDPIKRAEYHQKLMEAQAKEKFCGEIGNLLEQLRKKMEAASSTIRCTKCNSRHKKSLTDRPLFAARYCSQCRIHHGAREGELWAERGGWFGITWNYFACMDSHIWEINEWARCQKTNLKHIKADAHCVMYRLVAGGGNHQNHHNQHCHGAGASFEEGVGSEADEWDSLINNLYKSPPGSSYGKTSSVPGKTGCCTGGGVSNANNANGQATGKRRKGKRNK